MKNKSLIIEEIVLSLLIVISISIYACWTITKSHDGSNDICFIELGYRHHDILQRFQGEVSKKSKDQGFYTSYGRFVDREDAAYIALLAGQIDIEKCFSVKYVDGSAIRTLKPLYSEDLY